MGKGFRIQILFDNVRDWTRFLSSSTRGSKKIEKVQEYRVEKKSLRCFRSTNHCLLLFVVEKTNFAFDRKVSFFYRHYFFVREGYTVNCSLLTIYI